MDTWTLQDVDIAWLDLIEAKHPRLNKVIHAAMSQSNKSYLIYMAVRLLEMHRILKPTGSIYLHCDPTMSHYLKLVLDAIFGRKKFRSEIVWEYTGSGSLKMRQYNRRHDTIFWYVKGGIRTFNGKAVRIYDHDWVLHVGGFESQDRPLHATEAQNYAKERKVPEPWWTSNQSNGLAIAVRLKKQYRVIQH